MNKDEFLAKKPFSVSQEEKERFFNAELNRLTEHHRRACQAYDDICNGLEGLEAGAESELWESGPYLPVSLFKDIDLLSVPVESVTRRLTSSGTSGQSVSKINLDAETSAAQQRALCMITGDFIGSKRIPLLIIDSSDVLRDRKKYSARGAGIMGFSMMASKRFYALDENMNLNWDEIRAFQDCAAGGASFAFGFTFMIWKYFYQALKEASMKRDGAPRDQLPIDLSCCRLIHGGGWKKLQNESVSDAEFRRCLKEVCNIDKINDYYGMAEQTGSIFMQCDEGHLHASIYSDISILNPKDFTECEMGEWGLIALKSLLPESYPGHKLLTEDWGRIIGVDDCHCGRKGKYFEIQGRIKKAEVRGCSDTFEENRIAVSDNEMRLFAGTYPPEIEYKPVFDSAVLSFTDDLSALLMKEPIYRQYPEIYAFGFWCRSAHMKKLQEREAGMASRRGIGMVFHIAPSNMPTMFAYSWITSLLAGNSNVVRISSRGSEISDVLIKGINAILDKPEHYEIKKQNAFVSFPHEHESLSLLSMNADGRVIWGGDETVKHVCAVSSAEECIDIAFPDKYSIALFDAEYMASLSDEELKRIVHLFYNDTYGADQNACSSPKSVFWLAKEKISVECLKKVKERWWNALATEAEAYALESWIATEKYRSACCVYAGAINNSFELQALKKWGNKLYVISGKLPSKSSSVARGKMNSASRIDINEAGGETEMNGASKLSDLEGKFGVFYEFDLSSLEEIYSFLEPKIQTIVSVGFERDELWREIRNAGCEGVDRIVAPGEALDFDTVWDRKNIIGLLSKQ